MTNIATIDSAETSPTTATVDVEIITGESPPQPPQPPQPETQALSFRILPEIIRDTDGTYDIQATAVLPAGFGRDDVEDVLPILYLPEPYGTIRAHRQIVHGTATRAKIIALFDKRTLLNAMPDRGETTLTVVGRLTEDRSWFGQATVYLTKYTGR